MHIRVLGSGAGGGSPQWNCGCPVCRDTREGAHGTRPRMQSSICVSADGVRWALFNASPDVRVQLLGFASLAPRALRDSPVRAVVLSNADIDHAAGLLVLREGGAPPIYCTSRVKRSLTEGLRIIPALEAYGPVQVREIVPGATMELADAQGEALGITATPFAVASKPPPYMAKELAQDDLAGDTVGFVLSTGGASVVYVPGVRDLDEPLRARIAAASTVLIDGTFSTDHELVAMGATTRTARMMGHAPLFGAGGLVEFLDGIQGVRKVLIHINNSNPILRADSPERAELTAHGIEVSFDGMDL